MHSFSRTRGVGVYVDNLILSLEKYTDHKVILIEKEGRNYQIDVLHFPFFDLFKTTLPLIKKIPTVVTIHDVTPLIFPSHYPPGIKGIISNYYQKISLKNVKAVITDSYCSKKDIRNYLDVEEGKVFVVYLSQPDYFKPIKDRVILDKTSRKYKLPKQFALFTGSNNWNKNILNMSEACMRANIDLVIVGKSFEDETNLIHSELSSFTKFLEKYKNHPKIHLLGYVNNEDLVILINLSAIVLLPSFYEGFGFPILEGQACGVPVITSNISSMPELASEAALLVNPYSVDEITDAILKIKKNPAFRQALIRKGLNNAKRFSWEKTAIETSNVYKYAS